jgi:hypothetical protein
MKHTIPTDDQIRTQFVSSLMNYFKIDEDVFLRSHIDEIIRPIATARYSEFLRRLSTRNLAFKTGVEKISLIASEMLEEQRSPLELEAHERAQKLYTLLYDVRRRVSEEKNAQQSGLERFENIRFTSIKNADAQEALLDALDIDAVRILTKRWIYDNVANDRGLFEIKVTQTYQHLLQERQRLALQPLISPSTKKMVR